MHDKFLFCGQQIKALKIFRVTKGEYMKLSHLCVLAISLFMFWGCTNRYASPILIERGVGQNEYEREYFVVKESMGIDKHLKDVFKQAGVKHRKFKSA